MRPAVEALAARCRVVTDSLPGEPDSLARWDAARGFDQFVDHLDMLFAHARLDRAMICGVSFGGLIALRYASMRRERATGLALVSALPPGWLAPARIQRYIRYPRLSMPLFVAGAARRAHQELRATFPRTIDRMQFSVRHGLSVLRKPMSPARAAERMRCIENRSFDADCRAIAGPVLIVTGEPHLDRVVDTAGTLRYRALIPQAEHVTLAGTGHLGLITRPAEFAARISAFADWCETGPDRRAAAR